MEYPTDNQYFDLSAWEKDPTVEWKQNTAEQTNNCRYRLFGFLWKIAQLVIVHVVLKNLRGMRDILVINLFVCAPDHQSNQGYNISCSSLSDGSIL